MMPIQIRKAEPRDKAFILATWKRSYQESPVMRWTQSTEAGRSAYFAHVNRTCAGLLDKSHALVAYNPVDDEHCFGYVVCEPNKVVHYLYIKRDYRRQRIASRLLEAGTFKAEAALPVSHYTEALRTMRGERWRFLPELGEV